MSEQIEQMSLPPGWDCKYDARTGRYYYVNLFTKTTTWEDPRARFRQIQTGAPLHISNDSISVQELSPMVRSSPHTPRMGLGRHAMQETSFSNNVSAAETDATVAKINSMFPTVPETHIRMLLKKYYNREAVVISALQVEKHPLTTPGPYSTPPLPQRHFHNTAMGVVSAFQMTPVLSGRSEVSTSRTASPIPRPASCASGSYYGYYHGSPRSNGFDIRHNSPKPHSSPKMRLRYLKSFFPKADEDLILDVLANADNNVQTASQQLIKLGYEKRDQSANQRSSRKGSEKDGQSQSGADAKRAESQTPTAKPKSHDEKKKIKARLQTKYKDIAERIILMALESVDYSEDRAKQILNIVIQEDKEKKKSVKIDAPHKPDEDKENAQAGSSTPSRNNSTSSNHVRTPKKSGDEHPKPPSETENGGIDLEPSAAENENATPDASIEITTSTTNSTAIINDSPQSPLSQQLSGTTNTVNGNNQPQAVTTGSTDLNNNSSNSAAASASTPANRQPNRARAKADHAKYGFLCCVECLFIPGFAFSKTVYCTFTIVFICLSIYQYYYFIALFFDKHLNGKIEELLHSSMRELSRRKTNLNLTGVMPKLPRFSKTLGTLIWVRVPLLKSG
ncbi:uncharacterized protein LOC134215044 isoform X2 [Armigeres subalbatus]|uniref:uncharacterized protein LOC134215044 isoform X2 n=1 Tax=Armigeres subalbatus TaxID=124917 RepID=UPI002ED59E66